jgi:enoyl-[acyl-carrier-protein] reductase (NADH)
MTTQDLSPEMPLVAVVFGGRSPIATACTKQIACSQDVVLVTRKLTFDLLQEFRDFPSVSFHEADLEKPESSRIVFQSLYNQYRNINVVIFFQRYRSTGEASFHAHCCVELWSIKEALDEIRITKKDESHVQVLISSSPAAHKVVIDQDLSYHIVKSGQEALVRYCAAEYGKYRISVNAIRVGSIVLKKRANAYWNSVPQVISGLQSIAPVGNLLSSEDVGMFFATLALTNLPNLSGQILDIDNGFFLMDPSQVAKQLLET